MATGSQTNAQVAELANEIDRLSGQVAALIAFLEATGIPIPDVEFTKVQDCARKMARNRMGTDPGGAPELYAGRTVELLQKATRMHRPY